MQLLLNLLINASKFTPKGKIKLKVEDVSTFNTTRRMKVSVEDSGIGMNKLQEKNLRDKLKNLDFTQKISEASSGAGLGLLIGQIVAMALGPAVSTGLKFETEFGKGTTFTFVIEDKIPPKKIVKKKRFRKINTEKVHDDD